MDTTKTLLDQKVKEIISKRSTIFSFANKTFNTIKETFGDIEIPVYVRKWSWKTFRYVNVLVYQKLQITLRGLDQEYYEITIGYKTIKKNGEETGKHYDLIISNSDGSIYGMFDGEDLTTAEDYVILITKYLANYIADVTMYGEIYE